MNDSEWSECWRILSELWPRMVADMTGEQQASWRRALDRFSENDVRSVLRGWADTSNRYPKPPDIASRCRERRAHRRVGVESGLRSGSDDGFARLEGLHGDRAGCVSLCQPRVGTVTAERERVQRQRREERADMAQRDPDELRRHVRMIAAGNPHLRWLIGADPVASPPLRRFIYDRLSHGLSCDDARTPVYWTDDDEIYSEVREVSKADLDCVDALMRSPTTVNNAVELIGHAVDKRQSAH